MFKAVRSNFSVRTRRKWAPAELHESPFQTKLRVSAEIRAIELQMLLFQQRTGHVARRLLEMPR